MIISSRTLSLILIWIEKCMYTVYMYYVYIVYSSYACWKRKMYKEENLVFCLRKILCPINLICHLRKLTFFSSFRFCCTLVCRGKCVRCIWCWKSAATGAVSIYIINKKRATQISIIIIIFIYFILAFCTRTAFYP